MHLQLSATGHHAMDRSIVDSPVQQSSQGFRNVLLLNEHMPILNYASTQVLQNDSKSSEQHVL
jgi:hypothetical protein